MHWGFGEGDLRSWFEGFRDLGLKAGFRLSGICIYIYIHMFIYNPNNGESNGKNENEMACSLQVVYRPPGSYAVRQIIP